jgi:hypothetical protein
MKKNMGVIEVNLERFEFFGTQLNRRIKNILIPSIVWVEENADFLKFISTTPSYAKFEKCVVYISSISG